MKFKLRYNSLFFLLFTIVSFSQEINNESIKNIRLLIQRKDYINAEKSLSKYYETHSNDLETNWLFAQVLHWNNKNLMSDKLFQKAILLSPKNTMLQLDYARMLYESGYLKKTQRILSKLKEEKETEVEASIMDAYIDFWNGKIDHSKKTIDKIDKQYPNNLITKELFKKINIATSPYLKSNLEYQSDNQPIHFFAEKIEFGQYRTWLLNPKLEAINYNFTPKEHVLTAQFSNQFYFAKIGLSSTISGGLYKNFSDKIDWIGGIDFNQKIVRNTSLKLGYTKKPFLGTIASTTFNLTQNTVFGELNYENNKLFNVHTGYNYQFFKDKNAIQSFGAWLVSKPFKISVVKVQTGYGFGYSDSKTNLYTSKKSLSEVVSNFNPDAIIDGYYNPYFTPKNQIVHSAIVVLNYKPSKSVEIATKGNYGFIAKCQNPYIYLNTDEQGEELFSTNSSKATFDPFEITGEISYAILSNFVTKLSYTYQETFFYNRNNIKLEFNYSF